MSVIRLVPRPSTTRSPHGQCQFPLKDMCPEADGPRISGPQTWRQRRYVDKGKDPNFCVKGAAVWVHGTKYCNLHAGQILLAQALKEPHP